MAKEVNIELKVDSKSAEEDIKKVNEQVDKLNEGLEKQGKAGKKSEQGLSRLSKGTKGFGKALRMAGIGAVVALFGALATALSKNQKVMDAVAIVTGTISQVFTEVGNVLIGVYESVASSSENFDALGKVLSGIITLILTPFKLAWDGIKLGLFQAQLAWEESFFGDGDPATIKRLNESIDETKQSIKETGQEALQAGSDIVDNFGEAVSEVGDIGTQVVEGLSEINVKAIAENVKANEQLKKSAAEARIVNQGLIEQYDRQAEQQRQIRDDDLKSIDERIKANNDLKATLEEQEKAMLANADLMIQQAELQFKLSGLEEDRLALLEARNEKKAIEAQIEGFMSEQLTNTNSLLKEQKEIQKELALIGSSNLQQQIAEANQAYDAKKELIDREVADEQERAKMLSDIEIERDRIVQDAKLNMAKNTLANITQALGQNSKAGKAAAAAAALINTYQGITAELATKTVTPFEFAIKLANIATTAAIGFKSVKDILKTNPKSASSTGDTSVGRGGSTAPQAPAFNIVGQGLTNQLADVIAGQAGQPTRAYVVSNDVSTAQELDRNIIQGASIG